MIGAQLARILRAAGVPAGAVNLLPGPGEEIGEALVAHPERRPHRLHRLARRGPAHHGARRRAARPGLDQARDRRDGRQERDHRRRRRRPRRRRARDGRLGLRLPGAEVLGLLPGDRPASRPTTSSWSASSRRRAASSSARPTTRPPGSARSSRRGQSDDRGLHRAGPARSDARPGDVPSRPAAGPTAASTSARTSSPTSTRARRSPRRRSSVPCWPS